MTAAHRVYQAPRRCQAWILPVSPCTSALQLRSRTIREAFHRLRDLVAMLRADGLPIRTLDLGGGLGIPYGNEDASPPSPEDYARVAAQTVGDLGCRIIVEPGRMLVGNAGVLVTRVLRVKEGSTRTFVIVDAGMNDLPGQRSMEPGTPSYRFSSPRRVACCARWTSSGPSARRATFSVAAASYRRWVRDLLAIRTTGAYGRAMASSYNARPLPPEVLVDRRAGRLFRTG